MSRYISANDVLWHLCGDHIHVSGAARGYLFQGYVALWPALKTSAHSPRHSPSSVNPGVRPPGQFFLPVELKNEILRNMKYIGPQIFSWGDDHRQIIDLSTAGEVKIHMVDNTIITLERLNPNPQHNEFMMVAEWCQWAMERDGLQENLQKNLYEITEENQQNKQSEIPKKT